MVIDDVRFGENELKKNSHLDQNDSSRFASPVDRLGAVIIDSCAVLAPLIMLAISPLRRDMSEHLILKNEPQFMLTITLCVLVSVFIVWAYQSFMLWRFGATLGKYFLNLQVVSTATGDRPSFGQACLRSFLWIVEAPFLFPHLSVFSHHERRTFHDRLSDTLVISKKRPVSAPHFWEKAFSQGVYAALFAFVVLASVGIFKGVMDDLGNQSKILSLLEENGDLCAAVGAAAKTWPEEKVGYGAERLNVAMALFASGIISKSCLAQEAEHLSSHLRQEEPLLYLAQSFVQSEDADLSNEYLARVCKLDKKSEACLMSQIIGAWSEEDWISVDKLFNDLRGTTNLHMAVWAIRHLMKQQRFYEALTYIDSISPQKTLAPFLNLQRVKAYWNLNRFAEARAVAAGSLDVVDLYDSVELSSWLCQAELEQSCSANSGLSCRAFDRYMQSGEDLNADTELVLARARQLECGDKPQESIEGLALSVKEPRVKTYLGALLMNYRKNPKQARSELKALAQGDKNDQVAFLAKRRLIDWAESKASLETYYKEWNESEDRDDNWVKVGKSLFYKYHKLGNYSRALAIGRDLVSTPVTGSEFYQAMVTAAYHTGNRQDAKTLLKVYRELESDTATGRFPAAESEFQVITRLLDKEKK